MPQGPRRVQPQGRVLFHQLLDEILCVAGQRVPAAVALELAVHDGLGYLQVVYAAKGRPAKEEHVADDPQAPHVALTGVLPRQDLGAGVVQRAAGHVESLVRRDQSLREPEVYELQPVIALHFAVHPVLKLEIPVHNEVAVEVVQSLQHLQDNVRGIALVIHLLLAESAVQLATTELHDKPDVAVALVGMEQTADVRVVQPEVDGDLALQELQPMGLEAPLGKLLHRHPLLRRAVDRQTHRTRVAGAEDLRLHLEVAADLCMDYPPGDR
mmetsp:Transcript_79541/g.247648  ORF Transcript_79541/g.247648 Transcript_79541/m.247648 type:complete len:269 (+) Transcript_79541:919-1725(+)